MQKVLRVWDRTLRESVIREFGYKRLIKLVPADLSYPKLPVHAMSWVIQKKISRKRHYRKKRGKSNFTTI